MVCSAWSFRHPRSSCPGLIPPRVGWALLYPSLRKCPTDWPTGQYDGVISSIEVPSFPMTLGCITVTKNLTHRSGSCTLQAEPARGPSANERARKRNLSRVGKAEDRRRRPSFTWSLVATWLHKSCKARMAPHPSPADSCLGNKEPSADVCRGTGLQSRQQASQEKRPQQATHKDCNKDSHLEFRFV